ncbi:MAG: hypothetical protein NC411_06315 [Bacteroides sp.]|nr:hypothetical protein [Bacteroides sp.]
MESKTPVWMTILIIIFILPAFSFPILLTNTPAGDEGAKTFVWIYPFYMLLSAWLAWNAYPRRPYVSWILIVLMALSTLAVWTLALHPLDPMA